ncbi:MAG TPA: Rdx family protein [Burkholderiales bacterium]|nr:Rdx family protein [Burkholderiales bacterium]
MPRAASLAAEISEQFGIQAELIRGSGGIFDVTADGALIYSKHRTGLFPENAEVLQALRTLTKG